jgi:hypothetical protein
MLSGQHSHCEFSQRVETNMIKVRCKLQSNLLTCADLLLNPSMFRSYKTILCVCVCV